MMADENLNENLETYIEQLNQVDLALVTAAEDEELLKLKDDLVNVIQLTKELIEAHEKSLKEKAAKEPKKHEDSEEKEWKVGDRCRAPWYGDTQYHDAVIEEITPDGQILIEFNGYGGTTQFVLPSQLHRPFAASSAFSTAADKPSSTNKRFNHNQREYLKKRKQKKQQRLEKQEAAREDDKRRWKKFMMMAGKGSGLRGYVKKSIFATPDIQIEKAETEQCVGRGRPMSQQNISNLWRRHK